MDQDRRLHDAQPIPAPPAQDGFWAGIKTYLETADIDLQPEIALELLNPDSTSLPAVFYDQMWARTRLFLSLAKHHRWTPEQTLKQLELAATGQHDQLIEFSPILVRPGATLIPCDPNSVED